MEAVAVRKTDQVRSFVAEGQFKRALAIAKDFRLGITREQHDRIVRAYECMVHPGFYRSIGTDVDRAIASGVAVIVDLYGEGKDDEGK